MTKDDIIRAAKEAGLELIHGNFMTGAQEKFANLVAAAEREPESTTDMMMELADRLGELPDDVDPRAWSHLLVYAPKRQPLTDEQWFQAELFKLAVKKGLLSIHTELVAAPQTDPSTKVSWMEGHNKACDISNEAAHGIGDKT